MRERESRLELASISIPKLRLTTLTILALLCQTTSSFGNDSKYIKDHDKDKDQYSWDHNHSSLSNTNPTLVVQALPAEHREETTLLSITSRVNRAYAKRWGFDYLSFIGDDHGNDLGNDAFLLNRLLQQKHAKQIAHTDADAGAYAVVDAHSNVDTSTNPVYDTVLFLQPDALMKDLDYNIVNLIQDEDLIASGISFPQDGDASGAWTTYSNVMLWNLNHPLIYNATQTWIKSNSNGPNDSAVADVLKRMATDEDGNQERVLKAIHEIPKHMVDGWSGSLVQQANLVGKPAIPRTDLVKLQSISDMVCYSYYPQCELV